MKILVVDDLLPDRRLPAAILRRRGLEVLEAGSGEEALALQAKTVDITHVLLDVSMPAMSGLEVCAELRRRPTGKDMRIVAYTAHAFDSEHAAIMRAGFDDLLVKPIERDALFNALKIPQNVQPNRGSPGRPFPEPAASS